MRGRLLEVLQCRSRQSAHPDRVRVAARHGVRQSLGMSQVSVAGTRTADLARIRTDVVGSLLRPAGLKEARARFDDGAVTAEALRAIEDEAVREAVRLQESAGLDIVTDGEMRRLNFQDSFGASVEGYAASRSTLKEI